MDYGNKPNHDLLTAYGFTSEKNPNKANFVVALNKAIVLEFNGEIDLNLVLVEIRKFLIEGEVEDLSVFNHIITIDYEILCLKFLVKNIEKLQSFYITTKEVLFYLLKCRKIRQY